MDVVFTIVSRNYQAQAATLMESLAAAEPGVARVVVATDGPMAFADKGVRVIEAQSFVPNFAAMCAYYDALELNTAVKPHAFRALKPERDAAVQPGQFPRTFQPHLGQGLVIGGVLHQDGDAAHPVTQPGRDGGERAVGQVGQILGARRQGVYGHGVRPAGSVKGA